MAVSVESVFADAMSLPDDEKADLLERLLGAVGEPVESEVDPAYLAELRRRRDEVRAGTARTIPGPEALRRVRESLRR